MATRSAFRRGRAGDQNGISLCFLLPCVQLNESQIDQKVSTSIGLRHDCTISNGFLDSNLQQQHRGLLISTRDCYFAAGYVLTVE
jgi:hypothetical protein